MKTVSSRWAATVAGSHQISVVASVLYGGATVVPSLNVISGSVSFDRRRSIRSDLELELAEPTRVPTLASSGYLSPFGYEIAVSRGILYGDGTSELMPLGVFPIQRSSFKGRTLLASISANDRGQSVSDYRFEDDEAIAAGTNMGAAISTLLAPLGFAVSLPSTSHTTPGLVFTSQDDRWEKVQGMATSVGWELYFDGLGVVRARPEPNIVTASSVLTVAEGAGGVLMDTDVSLDRGPAYNRVIAYSSNATNTAVYRAVASDDLPGSFTLYGGPFGRKARFYASPFIGSTAQALSAANAILAQSRGVVRSLSFDMVPNPALEPGDAVLVQRSALGIDEIHLLDAFRMPLTAQGTMTAMTRAKQVLS